VNPIICAGLLIASPCQESDKWAFGIQSREVTKELWLQARDFRNLVDEMEFAWQSLGREAEWRVWKQAADYCHTAWDEIDNAFLANGPYAAFALERLRRCIGDENYRLGKLPPPWPIWLFKNED
jgi:hypothetical protein